MDINCIDSFINNDYVLYHGDCCDVIKGIPDDSIDYSIFSPPFAELYSYSNNDRDMGNSKSYKEFFEHFKYLVKELYRVIRSGRNVTVHCVDIPAMKERDGYIGLKDFPGDIIKCFQKEKFIYHSRNVIWKDPLIEVTRTHSLGLMHKQLCKNSTMCRAGLPDYLITFRKPGENLKLIKHKKGLTEYHGSRKDIKGIGEKRSHNIWRAYASPVWMDIRQTNTLNKKEARDKEDQKHICPLQLDVIHRCCILWSNPKDVILTPFSGVASEVFGAVWNGRKGIGIELKKSYYKQGIKNMKTLKRKKKIMKRKTLL